ncbi:hypothetical protein PRIPAC_73490, partial [Pristionchus pacificus]
RESPTFPQSRGSSHRAFSPFSQTVKTSHLARHVTSTVRAGPFLLGCCSALSSNALIKMSVIEDRRLVMCHFARCHRALRRFGFVAASPHALLHHHPRVQHHCTLS